MSEACDEASRASSDEWEFLGDDDVAWQPPTRINKRLVVPDQTELDFLAMGWENFERLIRRVASKLEGTENVHLYGRRGQRQDGIDVVCFSPSGETSIFQAKRRESLGADDLRRAVEDYVNGSRPIEAQRFVVVAACDAHDTETLRTLDELRRCHGDIEIEFWHRQNLSEILAEQPVIVELFFGRHAREVFCVQAGSASGETHADAVTLPEFVLRGPITQLRLGTELRDAEAKEQEDPQEAAIAYGSISRALRAASYDAQADQLQLRQADALAQADHHREASAIRLEVAWSLIDSADLWTARTAARQVDEARDHLSQPLLRSLEALSTILSLRLVSNPEDTLGTGTSLSDLSEAVGALQVGDPHRHLALLALGEEALAARRLDIVQNASSEMQQAIEELSLDSDDPLTAARMRCCIADAMDGWQQLWLHARTHYPPEIAALVSARWGRQAALQGNVALAIERYQDAIGAATSAQKFGDASNWLYALRTARILNEDRPSAYVSDIHRIAQTIRAHGDASIFPYGRTRTRALAQLISGHPPDAHEAIRHHLRHSAVCASLAEEVEAHRLYGQFLASVFRIDDALMHLILAGASKEAEQLATRWPELRTHPDVELAQGACWERRAAFTAAEAFEDRLPDDARDAWAAAALTELLTESQNEEHLWSNLRRAASAALAATAAGLSRADAEKFLGHVTSRLDNQQDNRVGLVDDCIAVLYEIALQHQDMSARCVATVMRLLITVSHRHMSDWASGADVLRCHQDIVRDSLTADAEAGDLTASIVMAAAGCTDEPVLATARTRLEQATAPPERRPGSASIGTGVRDDAYLVGFLDPASIRRFVTTMTALAVDPAEPLPNRREALIAATRLVGDLPESQRTEFYATALECAAGAHDEQGEVPLPLGPTDPLSRIRISFGPESIGPAALEFAAACATTPEQFAQVRWAALEMLNATDEYTACTAANAAALLPVEVLADDVDALRLRVDDWARWLAAVTWARLDDADDRAGRQLSMDRSCIVRSGLASALRGVPAHEPVRQRLLEDNRRSVRDAASRSTERS